MNKFLIVSAIILSTSSAFAQQPDPDFMQKAIAAIQAQRNSLADSQAIAEAKLAKANEDLNKANTKVKELTDKYEPKKPEDDKK